jgi:hypothetical protein
LVEPPVPTELTIAVVGTSVAGQGMSRPSWSRYLRVTAYVSLSPSDRRPASPASVHGGKFSR